MRKGRLSRSVLRAFIRSGEILLDLDRDEFLTTRALLGCDFLSLPLGPGDSKNGSWRPGSGEHDRLSDSLGFFDSLFAVPNNLDIGRL